MSWIKNLIGNISLTTQSKINYVGDLSIIAKRIIDKDGDILYMHQFRELIPVSSKLITGFSYISNYNASQPESDIIRGVQYEASGVMVLSASLDADIDRDKQVFDIADYIQRDLGTCKTRSYVNASGAVTDISTDTPDILQNHFSKYISSDNQMAAKRQTSIYLAEISFTVSAIVPRC